MVINLSCCLKGEMKYCEIRWVNCTNMKWLLQHLLLVISSLPPENFFPQLYVRNRGFCLGHLLLPSPPSHQYPLSSPIPSAWDHLLVGHPHVPPWFLPLGETGTTALSPPWSVAARQDEPGEQWYAVQAGLLAAFTSTEINSVAVSYRSAWKCRKEFLFLLILMKHVGRGSHSVLVDPGVTAFLLICISSDRPSSGSGSGSFLLSSSAQLTSAIHTKRLPDEISKRCGTPSL